MKCLLIFVFEVLITSHLCIEPVPDHRTGFHDDVIYLLQSNDTNVISLNKNFSEILYNLGYIVEEISVPRNSINETISLIDRHNRSIINLHVSDFYEHNFTDLPFSKIYIRYNGVENQQTVCVLNVTSTIKQPCNETTVITKGVMIFSKHVEGKEQILNILTNTEPDKRKHILVCIRNDLENEYKWRIKEIFKEFNIDFQQCDKVLNVRQDTLAVLVPKRIHNTGSDTPFIFYETTCLDCTPELMDRFPNSAELLSWQSAVVFTILEFLRLMKWRRIAVLSDDSDFSEIFERELISKFDENKNILYGVQQCSGRYCDFKEALTTLRDMDIKVIIANVDETNEEKLLKTTKELNMDFNKHWIFRGHLEKSTFNKKMRHFYNTPLNDTLCKSLYDDVNIEYLHNICKGIYTIRDIYEESGRRIDEFRRRIAHKQPKKFYMAEVYKQSNSGTRKKIATICKAGTSHLHDKKHYPDWPAGCTVKGDTFQKPCSDKYVIYIMMICTATLLFTLIILWFFDHLQRNPSHYVNI